MENWEHKHIPLKRNNHIWQNNGSAHGSAASLRGFTSQPWRSFGSVILSQILKREIIILSIEWANSCKAWHMPDNVHQWEKSENLGVGGTVGLQGKMNWLCRGVEFEMMVAITKARLETQDSSSAECPGPDTRIWELLVVRWPEAWEGKKTRRLGSPEEMLLYSGCGATGVTCKIHTVCYCKVFWMGPLLYSLAIICLH